MCWQVYTKSSLKTTRRHLTDKFDNWGRAFEHYFCMWGGGEFERFNLQSLNARGGILKFRVNRRIITIQKTFDVGAEPTVVTNFGQRKC